MESNGTSPKKKTIEILDPESPLLNFSTIKYYPKHDPKCDVVDYDSDYDSEYELVEFNNDPKTLQECISAIAKHIPNSNPKANKGRIILSKNNIAIEGDSAKGIIEVVDKIQEDTATYYIDKNSYGTELCCGKTIYYKNYLKPKTQNSDRQKQNNFKQLLYDTILERINAKVQKRLYDEADEEFKKGNYKQAIEYWNRIITNNPEQLKDYIHTVPIRLHEILYKHKSGNNFLDTKNLIPTITNTEKVIKKYNSKNQTAGNEFSFDFQKEFEKLVALGYINLFLTYAYSINKKNDLQKSREGLLVSSFQAAFSVTGIDLKTQKKERERFKRKIPALLGNGLGTPIIKAIEKNKTLLTTIY